MLVLRQLLRIGMLRHWLVGLLLILSLTAIIPFFGATCACAPLRCVCRVVGGLWTLCDSHMPTRRSLTFVDWASCLLNSAAAAHGDEAKNNKNAARNLREDRFLLQEQPTTDDCDQRYDVLINRCMRTAKDTNSNMPRCISQSSGKHA